MDQNVVLYTLFGMLFVTYLPRLLPVLVLSSKNLHPTLVKWLSYVPSAVLSAMLFPSLFLKQGDFDCTWNNVYFWAALPTFVVAWKTKSLFGSVLTGMGLVALARLLWGA